MNECGLFCGSESFEFNVYYLSAGSMKLNGLALAQKPWAKVSLD